MKSAENLSTPVEEQPVHWRRYLQMTKPTITLLVVFTAIPGLMLASSGLPGLALVICVCLGTALSSASAGVFNQIVDAQIDSVMDRTRGRPLPKGSVSTGAALTFGGGLGLLGFGVLYFGANPLAAFTAFAANIFYVLFYTCYLKKRTVQNIVIGGAAGAVGPLIGWAAVTGTFALPAWYMFALIFLWTPPHFWALAIKYKDDYERAGIPMLPVIKGVESTKRQIFWYSLSLFLPVMGLYFAGTISHFGFAASFALTGYFVWKAWALLVSEEHHLAMPLFHYSCIYLFALFGAMSAERFLIVL